MYPASHIAILAGLIAVVLAMSVKATLLVVRDTLSEPAQRAAQIALVWLFPILGALIVFGVHRSTEAPSRKYREEIDLGENDLVFRGGRGRSSDGADDD